MNKYIYIKDSNGNTNLWTIFGEISGKYRVMSRNTTGFINKDKCFNKKGYGALFTNEVLDIEDSSIEIESEEEYLEYLEGNLFDKWSDDAIYFEDCF